MSITKRTGKVAGKGLESCNLKAEAGPPTEVGTSGNQQGGNSSQN